MAGDSSPAWRLQRRPSRFEPSGGNLVKKPIVVSPVHPEPLTSRETQQAKWGLIRDIQVSPAPAHLGSSPRRIGVAPAATPQIIDPIYSRLGPWLPRLPSPDLSAPRLVAGRTNRADVQHSSTLQLRSGVLKRASGCHCPERISFPMALVSQSPPSFYSKLSVFPLRQEG